MLVGAAFAALQLLLLDPGRALSWDEAIYLSQVTPGSEAMHFAASRARGITLLVAPLLQLGASLEVVRVVLALASAAALLGAFLPWIGVVGAAAPIAAAVFGSGWLALFYGSEVMPNLWVALAGIGALGAVARWTGPARGRWDVAIAAALLFLAGLIRPFDAVLLCVVVVALVLLAGRDVTRGAVPLVAAAIAGCLPWAVEIVARYGSLASAFTQAVRVGRVSPTSPIETLVQYLATADGPPIGPVPDPAISVGTAVALVAIAFLSALALARSRGSAERRAIAVATAGAVLFAVTYVLVVGGIAPRFLAPAFALGSIPVGSGIVALWRGVGVAPVVRGLAVAGGLAWVAWQGVVVERIGTDAVAQRAAFERVGIAIRSMSVTGGECAVVSFAGYPQVGFPSGCRGRPFPRSGSVDEAIEEETGRGTDTLFVVVRDLLDPQPAGTVVSRSLAVSGIGPVVVYRVEIVAT